MVLVQQWQGTSGLLVVTFEFLITISLLVTFISCSDNGSVVLTSVNSDEKDKDGHAVVLFNQPLKCVCLENDSAAKINKSFIVGGATGQVIYHRTVWFAQKNVTLFTGADSPVSAISWRGNIVAWADSSQVRLMDVTTQTAICYLCCPDGVGPHHTLLPCSLFWESDCDLLVGWGDSFRHVELVATALPGGDSGGL